MTITGEQVRANRIKWIERLEDPKSKKATKRLVARVGGGMCCLGHGCAALGYEFDHIGEAEGPGFKDEIYNAPRELIIDVGISSNNASRIDANSGLGPWKDCRNLAEVNDNTDATSQDIGAYLRTVIEGGPDTPFRPLSEYPEGGA